ncbi:MAG: metallopeptidase TldD-related protein [Myxococcota bacterium]
MILTLGSLALAAAPTGPDVDTLVDALARNGSALALPNAPAIYHLRYDLLTLRQLDVRASLGSLVGSNESPFNLLAVEMRVGDPSYDNTGFGGWQDGFVRGGLPSVVTPEALANEAWRSTDLAYKQAVEQYARKASQFVAPEGWPGDYTLTGASVADEGTAPPDPRAAELRELAVALSGELVGPGVQRGDVYVGHESGDLLVVDTEGTRVRQAVSESTIRAVIAVRAADGMLLTDQRLWTVRRVEQLPPRDRMLEEARRMRDALLATAAAPTLGEEYVGPVVFEQDAALDLFRYVLVAQLEGTPPEIPFDSYFGELGEDRDPVRLGRRVLPPGWSVRDDPTARPTHPGSYRYDNEGTPARPLDLVADGIVRALAMSRVPRKGVDGTNGHARGLVGARPVGRVALVTVEPDRRRSDAKLVRKGLQLARAYGRDWVLVVQRLQEPAAMALDADLMMAEGIALPPPLHLVRRYADGREEPVRGADFSGIERWILRDIAAAGPQREGDWFAPFSGRDYASLGPTEGMASHLSAPEVLIGEVELVPARTEPREVPVLPAPIADAG